MRAYKEKAEWRAHEKVECCQAEEQQRVEAERCRAKEQAKKWVSYILLIMIQLTVLGEGGCCATVQQGQGQGIRATSVQLVCRAWA